MDLVVVNWSRYDEIEGISALRKLFGSRLRVLSYFSGCDWIVSDMDKKSVEWSRRWLRLALEEGADTITKVDPDTAFRGLASVPEAAEVAGDWRRRPRQDWIWLGAYQHFSRSAAERILLDPEFCGPCRYQDVALAASAVRLGLRAANLADVNGWSRKTDPEVAIMHAGRSSIPREPAGWVNF